MDENFGNKKEYNDILIEKSLTGTVVKYNPNRGFGFISMFNSNVEEEIFVYHNQIKNIDKTKEFVKLQIGQEVQFDLYSTDRGYVAKNVNIVGMNKEAAANLLKGKLR